MTKAQKKMVDEICTTGRDTVNHALEEALDDCIGNFDGGDPRVAWETALETLLEQILNLVAWVRIRPSDIDLKRTLRKVNNYQISIQFTKDDSPKDLKGMHRIDSIQPTDITDWILAVIEKEQEKEKENDHDQAR